jgi:flagellar motor switch/type III secretory pathway protein FliN
MAEALLASAEPVRWTEFPSAPADDRLAAGPGQIELRVELGSVRLPARQAYRLPAGTVVRLDAAADDPVEIHAGGRLLARGRLVVLEDRYWVRVSEICGKPPSA